MSKRYSSEFLCEMRNSIPISDLIRDTLRLPWRGSDGRSRFLCPVCSGFNTATNRDTNLARCFDCRRNFNPIDVVMADKCYTFIRAVKFLKPLLLRYSPWVCMDEVSEERAVPNPGE